MLPAYCSKQLLVNCDQVRGECVDGGLSGRSPSKQGVDPVNTLLANLVFQRLSDDKYAMGTHCRCSVFKFAISRPCSNNPVAWHLATSWYRRGNDARRGELACSRPPVSGESELQLAPRAVCLLSHASSSCSTALEAKATLESRAFFRWQQEIRRWPGSHDISEWLTFELLVSGGRVRGSPPFQDCLLLKRAASPPGFGRGFLREGPVTGATFKMQECLICAFLNSKKSSETY